MKIKHKKTAKTSFTKHDNLIIIEFAALIILIASAFLFSEITGHITATDISRIDASITPKMQAGLFIYTPNIIIQNSYVYITTYVEDLGNIPFNATLFVNISINGVLESYNTSFTNLNASNNSRDYSILWHARYESGLYTIHAYLNYTNGTENKTEQKSISVYIISGGVLVLDSNHTKNIIKAYADLVDNIHQNQKIFIITSDAVNQSDIRYCANNKTDKETLVYCTNLTLKTDSFYIINFNWSSDQPSITISAKEMFGEQTIVYNITNVTVVNTTNITVIQQTIGAGGIIKVISETKRIIMDLEYPLVLNATKGMNYTTYIKIINSGDTNLTNITIEADGNNKIKTNNIIPNLVKELKPAESTLIILSFQPLVASEDWLSFRIRANEIERIGGILINVVDIESPDIIKKIIDEYLTIVQKLKDNINELKTTGINTTTAEQLVQEAENDLIAAGNFFKIGMHNESLAHINKATEKIIQATENISYQPRIAQPRAVDYSLFLLIFIVLGLLIIFFILFKRRKKHRIKLSAKAKTRKRKKRRK